MTVFIQILLVQTLVCFIIDLSGFIQEAESGLSRLLKFKVSIPKPFSCSLCSGWWINLILLLCTGHFTLPYVTLVAAVSFAAKHISGFIRWVSELLVKLETLLYKLIR